MILIWGWRTLFKVLGVGEFHCPRCQADAPYKLRQPRRWFTFFFLPVFPVAAAGPSFVECQYCKDAYREQILQTPTNQQLGRLLHLAARATYARLVEVGYRESDHMVDRALAQVRAMVGDDYQRADLIADVAGFSGQPLGQFLSPLAAHMALQGREAMVAGFAWFAHSDGPPPAQVEEVVNQAAALLHITATHLAGITAQVTAPSPGAAGTG